VSLFGLFHPPLETVEQTHVDTSVIEG